MRLYKYFSHTDTYCSFILRSHLFLQFSLLFSVITLIHGQQTGLTLTQETIQLALDTQPGDEVLVLLIEDGTEQVFFSDVASSTITLVRGVPAITSQRRVEVRINGEIVRPQIQSESVILDWPSQVGDGFEILASRDGEFWMPRDSVIADSDSVSLSLNTSGDESEFFAVRSGLTDTERPPGGGLVGWLVQRGDALVLAAPDFRQKGDQPIEGALVQINGHSTKTDADGRFGFDWVESIQTPIIFEAKGLRLIQHVLIVPNRMNSLGTNRMSRQDAYEYFLKQAVNDGWVGEEGEGIYPIKTSQIVGTTHVIPEETSVSSLDVLERQASFNRILFDEPAWMFHLDPFSNQGYGHPSLIGLVGDVSGRVEIREYMYWPVIDGVSYWDSFADQVQQGLLLEPVEDPELYVTPNPPVALALDANKTGRTDPPFRPLDHPKPPCPTGKTYAVFFQGGTERTFGVSAEKFRAHIKPNVSKIIRPDVDILGGKNKSTIGQVYARIVQRLFPLMKPCDTLVLYLAGHGVIDEDENPGGAVIFVDGDSGSLGVSNILLPLRKLPACHLLVVVDSCFSGTMVAKNNNTNFETVADALLPDHVQALFVSSTDLKTAAQFRKVTHSFDFSSWSFVENTKNAGGLFTLELIAAGLGKKPISLNAFNKGVAALAAQKGSAASDQGALTFMLPAKLPCQPIVLPKDTSKESEPNDQEGTANDLEDSAEKEGEKTANGSLGLNGEDTDVWKSEFVSGDYRFEDLGGDYLIEIKSGDMVFEATAPSFEFEVPESGDVFIKVFGGTSENYNFTVSPVDTQTEVFLRNDTGALVTFEIATEGGEPIADKAITLEPGEVFERKLESTFESMRIINLHDSDNAELQLGAPDAGLTLNQGDRGMLMIAPIGIQSWLEPIESVPFSGLE